MTDNMLMMKQYQSFLETHDGAYPRAHVAAERELALWASDIGAYQDSGSLDPVTSSALNSIEGWAATDWDRRWLEWVRQYELWLEEHQGAHPRMNGVGTTPSERALGVWAARQRQELRTGFRAPRNAVDRARVLNERIPTLLNNGWAGWSRRLAEYTAWVTRHDGERPAHATADTDLERRLAKWLQRQRDELLLDRLPADRAAALERAVPGWSAGVDVSWSGRMRRYVKFVAANGGCAPTDGTGNKFEQFLWQWDADQRRAIADGLLDQERVRRFQSVSPNREHTAACRHVNRPRRRA